MAAGILPGIILAVALALPTMLGLWLLPVEWARGAVALLLAFIPAIYVGFAIADGRRPALFAEILHAVAFCVLAFLGLTLSWWYLVFGLFAHGLWDLAHHPKGVQTPVRPWYVPFCALYDWLVGGFVLLAYAMGA